MCRWKLFCKLLSMHLWQSLFLVKYYAFSIFLWTPLDGCVWIMKLFFEAHLILNVKTTFRLQKPHFVNVWWKHIKNDSYKWYLDNKEQEAVFLVVSRMCTLVLSTRFFARKIRHASWIVHPKVECLERNLSTPEWFFCPSFLDYLI